MRGIVHVRSNREKFGTEQKRDLRKFFLQFLGRSRENSGFDDGNFAFSYQRQDTFNDRDIEAFWCRRGPHGDEDDVAFSYFVLVFYPLFFKRITHDFVSALFEIIGVRFADPSLSDEADERFFACHDGRIVAKIEHLSSRDWMSDTSLQRLRITMP